MKRTGTHTLRGQVSVTGGGNGKVQIIVDDGRINTGYKVTGFYLWLDSASNASFSASLSMSEVIAGSGMDASDNSQIAWVYVAPNGSDSVLKEYIIDPDHIIVRDLFIQLSGAPTDTYNYMIVTEEYELSDNEAIINIIKEGDQSL